MTDWSLSGALTRSAKDALQLKSDPALLKTLVGQWSRGDFSGLPPIVLLPSASMPEAAGAYADSTKTIYLNQDWLKTANRDSALSVLTEELGHHLDNLLKPADTPGEEGELFSHLLMNGGLVSAEERAALSAKKDAGTITVSGNRITTEIASITRPRPISTTWKAVPLPSDFGLNGNLNGNTLKYSASIPKLAIKKSGDVGASCELALISSSNGFRVSSINQTDGTILNSLSIGDSTATPQVNNLLFIGDRPQIAGSLYAPLYQKKQINPLTDSYGYYGGTRAFRIAPLGEQRFGGVIGALAPGMAWSDFVKYGENSRFDTIVKEATEPKTPKGLNPNAAYYYSLGITNVNGYYGIQGNIPGTYTPIQADTPPTPLCANRPSPRTEELLHRPICCGPQ